MPNISRLLLRIALAFAFLYPAYGFWKNPGDWVGYIPAFAKGFASTDMLMMLIAGVHIVIALWLLSGWRIFIPSILAALFLSSVVYFNFNQIDVLFRDIALAIAALALAFSNRES